MAAPKLLEMSEVAKHNDANSCWVVVKDHVYDVTDFLPLHPAGASIILRYAGKARKLERNSNQDFVWRC